MINLDSNDRPYRTDQGLIGHELRASSLVRV